VSPRFWSWLRVVGLMHHAPSHERFRNSLQPRVSVLLASSRGPHGSRAPGVQTPESHEGSAELMAQSFPGGVYADVPGLCRVATLAEIEAQGWSLNPGRYVGMAIDTDDGLDFAVRFEELNEELERLNAGASLLQDRISESAAAVVAGSA